MAGTKPLVLEPGQSYLHITSSSDPQAVQASFASQQPDYRITYLGPVGELKGEYIFQVDHADGGQVQRDQLPSNLIKEVKGVEGVSGAKVLEAKQRAKRDEF